MNLLEAEEWHMFKEMHEQGMTVSEIARRTGVSRPTVRKYVGSDKPPVYGSSTGNGRLSSSSHTSRISVRELEDTTSQVSGYWRR
jgi:predicted transcriptional regulator